MIELLHSSDGLTNAFDRFEQLGDSRFDYFRPTSISSNPPVDIRITTYKQMRGVENMDPCTENARPQNI